MTANETAPLSSQLFDALPIITWSLPPDIDQDGQFYDVVDVRHAMPTMTDSSSGLEGRQSRCERLWPCSRRHRVRMNRSISPAVPVTASRPRSWQMARRSNLLIIGTFDGIECIKFSLSDGHIQKRSHHLFEPIRIGKSFDSPCFLDISEDGDYLAMSFDGRLYIYQLDDPFSVDSIRRVLCLPINGTIVSIQFVEAVEHNCFVCVAVVEAVIFIVDVKKAQKILLAYSPRRSLTDSFMFNFSSFGAEQSLQYALENISRVVRIEGNRFMVVGPRSDPLPGETQTTNEPIRVSSRMTFITIHVHIESSGRIDIRALDEISKDDASSFTPSRRLAQLLGQARSILTHASPTSLFHVVAVCSPKSTLIATLDFYSHLSLWQTVTSRLLGSVHIPDRPIDIAFWSESELVLSYESGCVRVWTITIDNNEFSLSEYSKIILTCEDATSSVNLSVVDRTCRSGPGIFVLASTIKWLQARRSWPEAQSASPSGIIIEHSTFKLHYLHTVPNEEAVSRLIYRKQFDFALRICSERKLDADPVYKRQWELADPIDNHAIEQYLSLVREDSFWKLEQCRLRCAIDVETQRRLLQFGLTITESASKDLSAKDEILWAYRLVFFFYLDLLETFILVQPYDMEKYSSFRCISLLETAMINARSERVSTLQVLLYRHHSILNPHIYDILNCFPETTPISLYTFLIPSSHETATPKRSQSARPLDWVEANSQYLERALSCQAVQMCPDLEPWIQSMSQQSHNVKTSAPVWFRQRALEIDSVSGLLSNALDLLRIGADSYPADTDLNVLRASAELFSKLIYQWDFDTDPSISLQSFHEADPMTKIRLLLRNAKLSNIADSISDRLSSELRGRPLAHYIVEEFAERSPAVVVTLIRAGIAEAVQVASECVSRCIDDNGDFDSLRVLAEVARDAETIRWVNSAAIAFRRHRPCPPSFFAGPDSLQPTFDLVNKLILDEVQTAPSTTAAAVRRYSALLDDLYVIVGEKHTSGAQELFLAAVLGSGQIDIGRHFSHLIDQERFQEIALMEARHQFNSGSENVDASADANMLTARAILALCDHSQEVAHERTLMHSWSFLYKIGLRGLKPIELRSEAYREQLFQRFVQYTVDNYEEATNSFWPQEFARVMNLKQDIMSRLLMDCALEGFKRTPPLKSFAETVMAMAMSSHSFNDGWDACLQIGGQTLLSHAIWSCPEPEILTCVQTAREEEVRNNEAARLESISVMNAVDHVIHKKSPKKLPLKPENQTLLLMRDSYVSEMAFLWSIPLPEAITLMEGNIATVEDAEFALKFVAIRILTERGQDVRHLLSLSVDELLNDINEERSIAALQKRLQQIERTRSLLSGLKPDVDMELFLTDAAYAKETLLELVHSLEIGDVYVALTLSTLYNHDAGSLFVEHLEFVFKTLEDESAMSHYFDQLSASCLKSVSGLWFEQILSTVDGTDYNRLSLLYQLRSRQPDLSPSIRSHLQKHVSILSRLASGRISLDYKVVLSGGSDAYLSVRAAVNDRTVAVLARVAPRIRELQEAESIPQLTESTILIDYLTEVLLSRPPSPSSYGAFSNLYGQYLSRLSLEHFAEVIRKVSHSQFAVDFVSRYVSENVDADHL